MEYFRNLPTLLAQVVTSRLRDVALITKDAEYTYSDILRLSLEWSTILEKYSTDQTNRVAIFSNKSVESYALILACNVNGIVYSCLDQDGPKERTQSMIDVLDPAFIIKFDKTISIERKGKSSELHLSSLDSNADTDHAIEQWLKAKSRLVPETRAAYVMFTSGSTGFPKGVVISHQSLCYFIQWAKCEYKIDKHDVISGLNQVHFDNSIFDFYCSLYNGARLAPVNKNDIMHPKKAIEQLDACGVTIWFSVPSYLIFCKKMKSLKCGVLPSLRAFIFGGEGFPKHQLVQLFSMFSEQVQFYNVYGPTETTCICSSYLVTEKDFDDHQNNLCPLGTLAPNFEYQIVEQDPATGIGELVLYGAQTALGYLNDKQRTYEKFKYFDNETGYIRPGYRTGDLVFVDEDHLLHFKGRVDFQIKHMGYRIELEEVEKAFQIENFIVEAVATYRVNDGVSGEILLHYTLEETASDRFSPEDSFKQWSKKLPSYMRPSVFIKHDQIPKNRNGKIDRKKLNGKY